MKPVIVPRNVFVDHRSGSVLLLSVVGTRVSITLAGQVKVSRVMLVALSESVGVMSRLGDDVVKVLYAEFWKIGDYTRHNEYTARCVTSVLCSSPRLRAQSRRTQIYVYHVMRNSLQHHVCSVGFLSIHGLGQKRIRVGMSKVGITGVVARDRQGSSETSTKVSEERQD